MTEQEVMDMLMDLETEMTGDDVNKFREYLNLPPLKPGKTTCLRCDKVFDSWDVRNNRICPDCKEYERGYPDGHACEAYPDCDVTIDIENLTSNCWDADAFLQYRSEIEKYVRTSGRTGPFSMEG